MNNISSLLSRQNSTKPKQDIPNHDSSSMLSFQGIASSIYPQTNQPPFKLIQSLSPIEDRIRNMQSPLSFIENDTIIQKKAEMQTQKKQFIKSREKVSQLCKTVYKKMVARQTRDYAFDEEMPLSQQTATSYSHQPNAEMAAQKSTQPAKDLSKVYKHDLSQMRAQDAEAKFIPINFKHLKIIETPQFEKKCQNVEFYNLVCRKPQVILQNNHLIDLNECSEIHKEIQRTKALFVENDVHFSDKSEDIFSDPDESLKFWREKKQKNVDFKKKCALINRSAPTLMNILDLAARKYTLDNLQQYYQFVMANEQNVQNELTTEELEEAYTKVKMEIKVFRDQREKWKVSKKGDEKKEKSIQTVVEFQQKSLNDLLNFKVKDLLREIELLASTRETVLKRETDFNQIATLLTNINAQINEQLFYLLLYVLKGQQFDRHYHKGANSVAEAEAKILQLIYNNNANFRLKQIDGMLKVDIIQRYLKEKEIVQKFNEIIQDKAAHKAK